MIFHPNAFALVTVPLESPPGAVDVARKTYKGTSIRVIPVYDGVTDESAWRLDVLYGTNQQGPVAADFVTGKIHWQEAAFGPGSAEVIDDSHHHAGHAGAAARAALAKRGGASRGLGGGCERGAGERGGSHAEASRRAAWPSKARSAIIASTCACPGSSGMLLPSGTTATFSGLAP